MESAVSSFALTVQRQLQRCRSHPAHIEAHAEEMEEIDIEDVDLDDPAFESLLVGRKVKVLLGDVDLIRWKQDLIEDRNRLATLHAAAGRWMPPATPSLRPCARSSSKCQQPINPGNRKVIVFTAFADTARYLYEQLAPWAKAGTRYRNRPGHRLRPQPDHPARTAQGPGQHPDRLLAPLQGAPRGLADEGELDLLIATDCISEGQNLQDCDWLINYDIHWNPVRIIQRFGRIDRIGSPNQTASNSSTSGPTWSWRNTSTWSSGSAAAWCCSTSPPPARKTSSSSSPATR
jgi:hypothetical protein